MATRILLALALYICSTTAWACTWYGHVADYSRYRVHSSFFGQLSQRGETRDQLGRVTQRWGMFETIKPIWGEWQVDRRVVFPIEVGSLELIEGRVYHIFVSEEGVYDPPCSHVILDSFESFEENRFKVQLKHVLDALEE